MAISKHQAEAVADAIIEGEGSFRAVAAREPKPRGRRATNAAVPVVLLAAVALGAGLGSEAYRAEVSFGAYIAAAAIAVFAIPIMVARKWFRLRAKGSIVGSRGGVG